MDVAIHNFFITLWYGPNLLLTYFLNFIFFLFILLLSKHHGHIVHSYTCIDKHASDLTIYNCFFLSVINNKDITNFAYLILNMV